MSLHLRLTQAGLAASFAFSFWGTFVLMLTDGLAEQMTAVAGSGNALYPGTSAPLKTVFTGIPAFDSQLTGLCFFFWSTINAGRPDFTLLMGDFAFQFATIYGICILEVSRPGNAGRWISYLAVWGLSMQGLAVANMLPMWALLYLATSPTVHAPSLSSVLPRTADLVSLPISLLLCYFVPVAAFSATSLSAVARQNWLAIWQFFPMWVAISQQILPAVLSPFVGLRSGTTGTKAVDENVEALRTVYTFLKYMSAFGHLSSFAVALRALTTPEWFAAGAVGALHPATVWLPQTISASFKAPDAGTAANLFLQYDRLGATTTLLIWAYYVYVQSKDYKAKTLSGNAWSLAKALVSYVFIGPTGAAVTLLEARDEAVLVRHGAGPKKVI